MKLLFGIKHLADTVGGAERVLCAVSSGLVARGHEVSIVTFDSQDSNPFFPLDARVNLINLDIGQAAQPANFTETVRRVKALRKVALSQQPDIVIGFMHSMFVPMAFALFATGIPTIGSEHIVPEHYLTRRLEFFLLKISAKLLNSMTVLSESIKSLYPDSVSAKMVVISNPVYNVSVHQNKLANKKERTLLNVGRLDEQKDQATLIMAFAGIADKYPDWNLRIIGNGALRAPLEKLIVDLDVTKRVELSGVTTDIDSEYFKADIFVISSRYESFGLVTAEAMSHGLPVVGFADCPGTNEIVQHEITGILVYPSKDRKKALATALSDLIENPALQKKLGSTAKKAIGKKFSIEGICFQWERLFTSVIREKV